LDFILFHILSSKEWEALFKIGMIALSGFFLLLGLGNSLLASNNSTSDT